MRRIDRIRSMSAHEIADVLIKTGICDYIDFCQSTEKCSDLADKNGGILQEMCRECMVKWLKEEG